MDRSANILPLRRGNDLVVRALLERLFEEHKASLCRFLRVRLGSSKDVDDFVQDVFLRLAQMDDLVDKVNQPDGNIRAYIISIANNLIVDRARHVALCRRHGLTEVSVLPDVAIEDTPESVLSTHQELEHVRNVLMGLNPKWRKAFVLSRFRFMSHHQIAEELGVRPKRVEKYIAGVVAILRQDRQRRNSHVA